MTARSARSDVPPGRSAGLGMPMLSHAAVANGATVLCVRGALGSACSAMRANCGRRATHGLVDPA